MINAFKEAMDMSRVRFRKENRKKTLIVTLLILAGLLFIVLSKTVLSALFTDPTMNSIFCRGSGHRWLGLHLGGIYAAFPQSFRKPEERQPDSLQTEILQLEIACPVGRSGMSDRYSLKIKADLCII